MEEDVHEYHGEDIEVSYDHDRCIHVRACVEGLADVFDPTRRPWIRPDEADADELAAVIERCPTGALHYERTDGGPAEAVLTTNTVTVAADGPLYLRGDVELGTEDDETLLEDTRVALCRCGRTTNGPLCDNSHARVFEAEGVAPSAVTVVEGGEDETADERTAAGEEGENGTNDGERRDEQDDGRLTVTPTPNGPLLLDGPFDLRREEGTPDRYDESVLCRCGGSSNKPFCDGTHAEIGFSTENRS